MSTEPREIPPSDKSALIVRLLLIESFVLPVVVGVLLVMFVPKLAHWQVALIVLVMVVAGLMAQSAAKKHFQRKGWLDANGKPANNKH